jgi:hypothetical protein
VLELQLQLANEIKIVSSHFPNKKVNANLEGGSSVSQCGQITSSIARYLFSSYLLISVQIALIYSKRHLKMFI